MLVPHQVNSEVWVGGAEDVLLGQVVSGDDLQPEQPCPLVGAGRRDVPHDPALRHRPSSGGRAAADRRPI